jgi:hypothetical protein
LNQDAGPQLSIVTCSRASDSRAPLRNASSSHRRRFDDYDKLPLIFEKNKGQSDPRVKFLSRTGGYSVFLTEEEMVLAIYGKTQLARHGKAKVIGSLQLDIGSRRATMSASSSGLASDKRTGKTTLSVLRTKLFNASMRPNVVGVDQLPDAVNYFIGNDPTKWRTKVLTYSKVKYESIYPGIDLVYYGSQGRLEYDFIVAPGADPRRIVIDVSGAKQVARDSQGDLVFKMPASNDVFWHKPIVYQEKDGVKREIDAHYAITATNRITFDLANYDVSRPLYIDPLIYSTYLGGQGNDGGAGIAVDKDGSAYVVGTTSSADFPITGTVFQSALDGPSDVFITKFNPEGSALIYSTFLGGSGPDAGLSIAVDGAGNAYVTGITSSTDFPTTPGAFRSTYAGEQDGFVTKLNPSGSALVYSGFLGGTGQDQVNGIAVDGGGNAYVTGFTQSTNFPTTSGAFQTVCGNPNSCNNAFVTAINSTGSGFLYSTYLGGSYAQGEGIAVDKMDSAYVVGNTQSGFPTTSGAVQTVYGGEGDGFIAKMNPSGSALAYSTYLGGGNPDQSSAIAVDASGNAYVAGYTASSNFPITTDTFEPTCNDGRNCSKYGDAFVTKINASGSALVYSTFLGGNKLDYATGIAVDSTGDAYVVGITYSKKFPTTVGALETKCCNIGSGANAFMTKVNSSGTALAYSTYLESDETTEGYGVSLDAAGNTYVTGLTGYGFITTSRAFQTTYAGGVDAFVTKVDPVAATMITLSSSPNPSIQGQTVTFSAVISSSLGSPPDGETVAFMKGSKILGTGALGGGSAVFMTSVLKVGTTSVRAVYGGDSTFAGSTSKAVKQVVEKSED